MRSRSSAPPQTPPPLVTPIGQAECASCPYQAPCATASGRRPVGRHHHRPPRRPRMADAAIDGSHLDPGARRAGSRRRDVLRRLHSRSHPAQPRGGAQTPRHGDATRRDDLRRHRALAQRRRPGRRARGGCGDRPGHRVRPQQPGLHVGSPCPPRRRRGHGGLRPRFHRVGAAERRIRIRSRPTVRPLASPTMCRRRRQTGSRFAYSTGRTRSGRI